MNTKIAVIGVVVLLVGIAFIAVRSSGTLQGSTIATFLVEIRATLTLPIIGIVLLIVGIIYPNRPKQKASNSEIR